MLGLPLSEKEGVGWKEERQNRPCGIGMVGKYQQTLEMLNTAHTDKL